MNNKYAFLVGINKYIKPGNDLAGCINDAMDIKEFLVGKGWDQENIKVITDLEATRDGILSGVDWLIGTGGKELLFCYSGHGSQVPSKNPYEVDGLDEIICPADMGWKTPLLDDTLKEIFLKKASESFLTVILDCCHSQHGTRGSKLNPAFNAKSKYLPYPYQDEFAPISRAINRFAVKQKESYGDTCSDMNHVLLSACLSTQTAADAEFRNRPNGAWTWSLLGVLNSIQAPTNAELHKLAAATLRTCQFEQRPCIEGNTTLKNRLFLGGV